MPPKDVLKPRKHLIANRTLETCIGVAMFVFACILLYDAWDARGKKMPWPFGGLAPW